MAITDKEIWAKASHYFRLRRNRALSSLIAQLPEPRILDVGGLPDFWLTVPAASSAREIVILNSGSGEYSTIEEMLSSRGMSLARNMRVVAGDACALEYADNEFDLVVCNSVLEHVGEWNNAERAAAELRRVAAHGWVQVPAYEFPLEVHYMRPFVQWFAEPTRAAILRLTVRRFRGYSPADFREMFERTRLLTKREMKFLFPKANYIAERFLGIRKSHIITW